MIDDLCKSSDSFIKKISDLRKFYEEFDEKIYEHIDWQENWEGRATYLPRIEESQKDIVFGDSDIKIK